MFVSEQQQPMPDVFISYKREDKDHAERLVHALRKSGFEPWYDFELISGDQFRNVIRRVIDLCPAAVVVWSHRSVASEFVLDEATHAKAKGKLCPVRIDDVALPFGFGQSHTDDLSNWSGEKDNPAFTRLLRALEIKIGRTAGTPLPAGHTAHNLANLEYSAFKSALAARNSRALQAFLDAYPDGSFASIVRDELTEQRSVIGRYRRLGTYARTALAIALLAIVIGAAYLGVSTSVDRKLDTLTGSQVEPLSEKILGELVRRALSLNGQGQCSPDIMEQALLDACRAQLPSMQQTLEALGPIIEVKSEGRHRSAASGGAYRTRFLVTFKYGKQKWEALGSANGKLSTFYTSSM